MAWHCKKRVVLCLAALTLVAEVVICFFYLSWTGLSERSVLAGRIFGNVAPHFESGNSAHFKELQTWTERRRTSSYVLWPNATTVDTTGRATSPTVAVETAFTTTSPATGPQQAAGQASVAMERRRKVLVLCDGRQLLTRTQGPKLAVSRFTASPDSISTFLEKHNLQVTLHVFRKSSPHSARSRQPMFFESERNSSLGDYAAVVVHGLGACDHLGVKGCAGLQKYCDETQTGLVVFPGDLHYRDEALLELGLPRLFEPRQLSSAENPKLFLNPASPVLHIARSGQVWKRLPRDSEWYEIDCQPDKQCTPVLHMEQWPARRQTVGASIDGKAHRSVLFGLLSPLSFFLSRILLLDALHFVSKGQVHFDLVRRVQVDIDDGFLGEFGMRPLPGDIRVSAARLAACNYEFQVYGELRKQNSLLYSMLQRDICFCALF